MSCSFDFFVREYVEREAQAPTKRHDRPRFWIRDSLVEPRHAIVNVAAAQRVFVAFEFRQHDWLAVSHKRDERLADANEGQHRIRDVLIFSFVA